MDDASALAASWDRAYLGTPAWDIGRPQPAFADLADVLAGTVVEFGCGTGENILLAASRGADAIGLDISPRAIGIARDKAAARGLAARFEVADVLDPEALPVGLSGAADVLIDSGTFHMFAAPARRRYAAAAQRVLRAGARCYLLCARPDPQRRWGPPGVSAQDAATAFGDAWRVVGVREAAFEVAAPLAAIPAHLIMLDRGPAGARMGTGAANMPNRAVLAAGADPSGSRVSDPAAHDNRSRPARAVRPTARRR